MTLFISIYASMSKISFSNLQSYAFRILLITSIIRELDFCLIVVSARCTMCTLACVINSVNDVDVVTLRLESNNYAITQNTFYLDKYMST